MRSPRVLAVAVAVAVALVGFRVFEHFEQGGVRAQASQPCPPAAAGGPLPLSLPVTEGEVLRNTATQGRITAVFADIPGGRDDVEQVRDRILRDLQTAGYQVVDTDQEPGIEAEAEIAGPHRGTLRVKPLCVGLLEVRYALDA